MIPLNVLVLAGGQGIRLWPLSRKDNPKQFLPLASESCSLLQDTLRRALQITGDIQQVLVSTQAAYVDLVKQQLPHLPESNILPEPAPRNTAAAIGLAAMQVQQRQPHAIMLVLPADHLYRQETAWFEAIQEAINVATQSQYLVTIGIPPSEPSSKYGYLHIGSALSCTGLRPCYHVIKYIEKPAPEIAQTFIQSKDYLWNTGTFAWKVSVFLEAMQHAQPGTYATLEQMTHDPSLLADIYPTIENISVDYAVMEKSSNVVVVEGAFERIDVGSLASLAQIWQTDPQDNAIQGNLVQHDSHDNIVFCDDGVVGLLGVDDMVVIRHRDVLLVCPKQRAGEIKILIQQLIDKGLGKYQ
jgi:mannose-1-phosphate guanylyltransferase